MAKPRTFVSSTCLDLKDARSAIEAHLIELGHEPLLSDTLNFGVRPKRHSHQACLDQVDNADYFILIVGGRRGGTYIGTEKSITNEEYRRAIKRGIPLMTFVSQDVMTASPLYRKNPTGDFSDLVDDKRVFDFIDLIRGESEDNWIRTYKTAEDIKEAITAQLAYICLLYSQQVRRKPDESSDDDRRAVKQFPRELDLGKELTDTEKIALTSGLKSLHRIISKILSSQAKGKDEKLKVIWLLGRYGENSGYGSHLGMSVDQFKQYAFGVTRAQRVFTQLKDFDVQLEFDDDVYSDLRIKMWFRNDDSAEIMSALQTYVTRLLEKHSEDDSLELFKRADMSVFA